MIGEIAELALHKTACRACIFVRVVVYDKLSVQCGTADALHAGTVLAPGNVHWVSVSTSRAPAHLVSFEHVHSLAIPLFKTGTTTHKVSALHSGGQNQHGLLCRRLLQRCLGQQNFSEVQALAARMTILCLRDSCRTQHILFANVLQIEHILQEASEGG